DGDALPLAAGELHAALANDGVVLLVELRDEFVTVRDARHFLDLLARRMRARERDVLGNRAVEEEVVLQYHAKLGAIIGQRHGREIPPIHEHAAALRSMEREYETDQRALARSRRTDECRGRPRPHPKGNVLEDWYTLLVRERYVFKRHVHMHHAEPVAYRVICILM